MVTKGNRDFIRRLQEAFIEAQEALDQLPLSIPGPIRDHYFGSIVSELMDAPHRSETCPGCRTYALSMATSALGWEDQNKPRPATVQERMGALQEQIRSALNFLNTLPGEDR